VVRTRAERGAARTPYPPASASASWSAAQRKKPPGWPARPTNAQRSPAAERLTPHMTIATRPVAACVKRQK